MQVVGEENDLQSHRIVMTIGTVGAATHFGKPTQPSSPMPLVAYDSMLTGELPDIDPNIDRSAILRLPSPVENVYLAAGGNYLVMEMPGIELIGIFDVTAGKMIAYLSHQADVIATSADSIVLSFSAAHRLERWQIPQLKRVAEKQLEDRWHIKDLRMGSNASRWLAVDHGSLFNAADFSLDYNSQPHARSWRAADKEAFQISPDENLFVVNEFDKSQILTFSMPDKEWQFRTFPTRSKLAIPTGDGNGIIVDQGVLDISGNSKTGRLVRFRSQLFPAAAGPWGLQLPEVQRLAGNAISTHRLNIVNFKTGRTIGAIDGLFEISDLLQQHSAWLLPKQERFLQLDPSRTLLLRKQVRLSE